MVIGFAGCLRVEKRALLARVQRNRRRDRQRPKEDQDVHETAIDQLQGYRARLVLGPFPEAPSLFGASSKSAATQQQSSWARSRPRRGIRRRNSGGILLISRACLGATAQTGSASTTAIQDPAALSPTCGGGSGPPDFATDWLGLFGCYNPNRLGFNSGQADSASTTAVGSRVLRLLYLGRVATWRGMKGFLARWRLVALTSKYITQFVE
ncbi:hypothetical protein B0T26DRAFT_735853 [Lasiosphaeria miniovina]|uniref:Uncharacterized protein n=1 Tax=Lasiosphaeria miniovina TaxID=1954250 RepID=A0AA39ZR45_9PEZI|nr:uncharacterized protein B0T26DRAFT_735853 [Lasiosphaeria miniovina]KAK0702098.1 hypothetical protein B0T26DRAFT_735853 [Lasiosphaeria miniovina]